MRLWEFFASHQGEILEATLAHLFLVTVSMAIAIAIGLPLGMLLVQKGRARSAVLAAASVVQTIPSLALFGFLISRPGATAGGQLAESVKKRAT